MNTPNPADCPLCQQTNCCAMANEGDSKTCWCMTASIPVELLAQMPVSLVDKACVCQNCLHKFITARQA